jgi:AMP phosphorylase
MELKVKIFEFSAGRPIAIINQRTADKINVHVGERISISKYGDTVISMIDVSKDFVKPEEIAVSEEVLEALSINEGELVEIGLADKPRSTQFIKKKIEGRSLEKEEIAEIIRDIVNNALTEAEIAYFVSSVYKCGMSLKETEDLIWAMVATGKRLNFSGEVVDKHSIGGIAGNRTTPIIIPICASAGLKMPKTSSRAITSAAGTADVVETIAKVEFTIDEIKKIVEKTNACMVWNGILGLSPADDKLIQTERIINIDPEAQLLASVLSKKIAVGSKIVLIDIPYGKTAKVDYKEAIILKKKFELLGKKFGLRLIASLTDGSQPIGKGVGPWLEIREIIKILKREKDCSKDLEEKSIMLAGQILELTSKAKKGRGKEFAREILNSGKAFNKFKEIIHAQSGKIPTIEEINHKLGKFKKDIICDKNSKIKSINNKATNFIASISGCPADKGSGIYFHKKAGDKIKKGDKILTIYSESQARLHQATDTYEKLEPVGY